MAYFYEHIKGILSDGSVTKINFQTNAVPTITTAGSVISSETNWGSILVTGASVQTINGQLLAQSFKSTNNTYYFNQAGAEINFTNNTISFYQAASTLANIKAAQANFTTGTFSKDLTVSGSASFGQNIDVTEEVSGKTASFSNSCTALYFNTTSDKRFKTDLKILDSSEALKCIEEVPVFSFTFKETGTQSIGIMAQDIDKYNFNNFSIVDKSNPYKWTIYEDKLVYITWSALQSIMKRIDTLEQEVKKLRGE